MIEERVSETRLGMDAYREGDPPPDFTQWNSWDQLSWGHLIHHDNGLTDSGYPNVEDAPVPNNDEGYTWDSDAATIARITVQKPVRIAVHAAQMLPE
ncbi:hypothetical protein [Petrachloros mirabilis]